MCEHVLNQKIMWVLLLPMELGICYIGPTMISIMFDVHNAFIMIEDFFFSKQAAIGQTLESTWISAG